MPKTKIMMTASGILLIFTLLSCLPGRNPPSPVMAGPSDMTGEAEDVSEDAEPGEKTEEARPPEEKQNQRRKTDFRKRVSDYGVDRFHGNRHLRDTK